MGFGIVCVSWTFADFSCSEPCSSRQSEQDMNEAADRSAHGESLPMSRRCKQRLECWCRHHLLDYNLQPEGEFWMGILLRVLR
jgi:hypothetical protein